MNITRDAPFDYAVRFDVRDAADCGKAGKWLGKKVGEDLAHRCAEDMPIACDP